MQINARRISKGKAEGEALISTDAISFLGGINPKTGICEEPNHSIEGKCIANKILIFPRGKGSTVGSYVMLQLKKNGKAPAAIINLEAEPIIAVGAIISNIPMVDKPEKNPLEFLKEGQKVKINADDGIITTES